MQTATVYLRSDGYFIHADSRTTAGVWDAHDPYLKIPPSAQPEVVRQAIDDALDASRIGIAHEVDWDSDDFPLPKLAGERSWGAFMKKAKYVSVERFHDIIRFTPSVNCGPREGYTPLPVSCDVPIDCDADTFADALARAFDSCQVKKRGDR